MFSMISKLFLERQAELNWLITGGCGFIGTQLINHIHTRSDIKIRVLDNLSTGDLDKLNGITDNYRLVHDNFAWGNQIEVVIGDVVDYEVVIKSVKGADIVVHLAANAGVQQSVEDPLNDLSTNVLGTFNLLESSRLNNVKKFIFASSGAPLGSASPPIHEELPTRPLSPYGASKLCGEAYCSAYFHSFKLQTIALRFGNVYGPGSSNKSSVVAKFIKEALDNNITDWEFFGNGGQTRDFIFITDLVRAIQLASENNRVGGEIFQIATSKETSISELAEKINNILPKFGIDKMGINKTAPRIGDAVRNYSDTSKSEKLLNWRPKTSLDNGLKETLIDFIKRKELT